MYKMWGFLYGPGICSGLIHDLARSLAGEACGPWGVDGCSVVITGPGYNIVKKLQKWTKKWRKRRTMRNKE